MRRRLLLTLLLAGSAGLRAHPEIEVALQRLNAGIAAAPTDAALYLERGKLYARHDEATAAEANYLLAAELAPNLPGLARARGALALATGQPAEALELLNRAVLRDPIDATARVFRGRVHAALHDPRAAVADFDAAIQLVPLTSPELILERAALLPAPEALRSLDAAIERLGPAIALQLHALALEESLGRTDAALVRLDRIATQSERRESWLKRRGDLLLRAGRIAESRAAYASALAAVASLPAWLRDSPESVRLTAELTLLSQKNS